LKGEEYKTDFDKGREEGKKNVRERKGDNTSKKDIRPKRGKKEEGHKEEGEWVGRGNSRRRGRI
jgi:hypothetical protein